MMNFQLIDELVKVIGDKRIVTQLQHGELVGSRFFGTHNEKSDYDIILQWYPEVEVKLLELGFICILDNEKLDESYYEMDSFTKKILRYKTNSGIQIDVQLCEETNYYDKLTWIQLIEQLEFHKLFNKSELRRFIVEVLANPETLKISPDFNDFSAVIHLIKISHSGFMIDYNKFNQKLA